LKMIDFTALWSRGMEDAANGDEDTIMMSLRCKIERQMRWEIGVGFYHIQLALL
jgi:hypothetical protein